MADNKTYVRTNWVDGETQLNANNMNNIENGIEINIESINQLQESLKGKGDVFAAGNNTFTGTNTFNKNIDVNGPTGKSLSIIAASDVDPTGYKALDTSEMPAGVGYLTARFLRLETKDVARADYEANDIKYGNITTTMTLKFPAIDTATTTKTIATEEGVDTKIQTALGTVETALEQIDTGTGV